jgi:hypothetical protein
MNTWNNGEVTYRGSFQHGLKHGQGKYEFRDGSYYEGNFEYNC